MSEYVDPAKGIETLFSVYAEWETDPTTEKKIDVLDTIGDLAAITMDIEYAISQCDPGVARGRRPKTLDDALRFIASDHADRYPRFECPEAKMAHGLFAVRQASEVVLALNFDEAAAIGKFMPAPGPLSEALADLLYGVLTCCSAANVDPADALQELLRRHDG